MGQNIYLNYASTTPAKSPGVVRAVTEYLNGNRLLNPGRNPDGLEDAAVALESRTVLQRFFGAPSPLHVVFTAGITASLNMALAGLLKPGDHAIATSVEHNAVARPLTRLEKHGGVEITWLRCAPDGSLDPDLVDKAVKKNSRLLVMTHASNALGTVLPAAECFARAKRHGLATVLDSAQTAGGIEVKLWPDLDVLAFTGHKGLGGLPGSGGLVLGRDIAGRIEPWLTGGTGSASDSLDQPAFLPDRFEPGTPNTLGILALGVAVRDLLETGVDAVRRHEQALTRRFLEGVGRLPLAVHGTGDAGRSTALVSVTAPGRDPGVMARRLFEDHGIVTRSGLHCSPLAHRTAGTFPQGTLRFSFGRNTTEREIDLALEALGALLIE